MKPPPLLRFLGTHYRNTLLLLLSMQHGRADFTGLPSSSSSSTSSLHASFLSPKSEARILFLAVSIPISACLGHGCAQTISWCYVLFWGQPLLSPSIVSLHQSLVAKSQGISCHHWSSAFLQFTFGKSILLLFGGAKILGKKIKHANCTSRKLAVSSCWEWLSTENIEKDFYGSTHLSLQTLPSLSFPAQPVTWVDMPVSPEQQCLVSPGSDHNALPSGLLLKSSGSSDSLERLSNTTVAYFSIGPCAYVPLWELMGQVCELLQGLRLHRFQWSSNTSLRQKSSL